MRRRQRGPHPHDKRDFASLHHETLRRAVSELSWLLTRGYPAETSLKFVGDRYQLTRRQRIAVGSCSVGDAQLAKRLGGRVAASEVGGRALRIDAFNCIITLEAALSGALIISGRDQVWRDLSRVRGSYRPIVHTERAIELLGLTLVDLGAAECEWCLDRPVSNSGRLRAQLAQHGADKGLRWTARLCDGTDREIIAAEDLSASSDSWILDKASAWIDLAGHAIRRYVPDAWRLDLS